MIYPNLTFINTKWETIKIKNNEYNRGALNMLNYIAHEEWWEEKRDFYFLAAEF